MQVLALVLVHGPGVRHRRDAGVRTQYAREEARARAAEAPHEREARWLGFGTDARRRAPGRGLIYGTHRACRRRRREEGRPHGHILPVPHLRVLCASVVRSPAGMRQRQRLRRARPLERRGCCLSLYRTVPKLCLPTAVTTRVFYSKLLLQRSAMYTRCIDSNLESGRYISRVGRASSFLSLYGTYGTVGTYGTAVPTVPTVLLHMTLYCC